MVAPNRRTVLRGLLAGGAAAGLGVPAAARSPCSLNWRRELSQHEPAGSPTVNATQGVENDIDSGFNGYWAYLDYSRTLRLWETAPGTHQVVVTYHGQFDGVAGRPSPGENGGEPLSGDEDGPILGGYAAEVTGELRSDPAWPTHGHVGTYDYEGDVETGEIPGYVDWIAQYVEEGYGFSYDWWGWIYRGGRCGTWVNAQGGSCGDVLCE